MKVERLSLSVLWLLLPLLADEEEEEEEEARC